MDSVERDNKIILNIEMPYLSNEHQIKIATINNRLIIYGTITKENSMKYDNIGEYNETYSEYIYKEIELPVSVEDKKIEAAYNDGILNVIITKQK